MIDQTKLAAYQSEAATINGKVKQIVELAQQSFAMSSDTANKVLTDLMVIKRTQPIPEPDIIEHIEALMGLLWDLEQDGFTAYLVYEDVDFDYWQDEIFDRNFKLAWLTEPGMTIYFEVTAWYYNLE